MSLHIYYDHNCKNCGAPYIPYDTHIACPKCGTDEGMVADDIIYKIARSAKYQKRRFGVYTPIAWLGATFGDKIAYGIFCCLDKYEQQEEQTFEEFAKNYFDTIKYNGNDYLKTNLYGLTCRVFEEIKKEDTD